MIKKCLAVRHVAFEDLGLLGPLLAARGYDVHYLDAGVQPFDPETLIAPDLVIVLGGPIGVYERDAYPFIGEEIAAVAARIESNKPILGICLGAQLMAAALGARVAPGPVKEIGWAPLMLTEAGQASVLSVARRDAGAALAWRQLRVAGRLRAARLDAALPGAGVRALRRRSSACSFIWRPSRRGSRVGSSATLSSSARPASIRAICGRRPARSVRRRVKPAAKC